MPRQHHAAERADDPAALRDASRILERVCADQAAACDEEAAAEARARFRSEPMPCIPPDDAIAQMLGADERVLSVRREATIERRQGDPASSAGGLAGDLYITSRRLVFRGRLALSIDLEDIDEAMLSGDRLLLVTRDGAGIAIDADRPRLLRVEIAAARAALRE
jgi:hypothetical protein